MNSKDCTLDIELVDFNNASEVWDFANRIITAANAAGLFMVKGCLDKEQKEIKAVAKNWINRMEAAIDSMNAGDALTVIYIFDFIHRIAYNAPADASYLDRYRLGAFESYVRGDKSVDQYVLFHTLSEEIGKRNKAYFGRPLEWLALCLERWHRNFVTGVSAVTQSDYDTVRQVTALLFSDLWAFEKDQDAFKCRLVATHLDYLAYEPAETDTKMEKALNVLRFHASKYLSSEKYTA